MHTHTHTRALVCVYISYSLCISYSGISFVKQKEAGQNMHKATCRMPYAVYSSHSAAPLPPYKPLPGKLIPPPLH